MKLTLRPFFPALVSVLCFFALEAGGQPLEVTNGATNPYTPENLISNIFLGEGVEVLSVQYFGVPTAVGFFKSGEDEVGIDRGIVMTTGAAANMAPNTNGIPNPGSTFASSNNMSTVTDPDLAAIATGGIFNGAKYVITFIPTADTLRFRYVFGSEEYPEYACTNFNDVFGFFISGPGINGPFENNGINIALIPGTGQNVSINNLHPQNGGGCPPVNEQYYNNNNGMSTLPVYDGFTDVFTAQAVVTPCEVYTIKLLISDVGDPVFDTGVFLEAKSFGTGSLDVDIATASLDGTITEDCSDAVITFTLPGPTESDFLVDFNIFGTAANGVDYTTIPDTLIIPAGDSTISFPIHAFEDGITEGLEFIGLDVRRDVCNRDTFYINIRENELIPPELGPDLTVCALDTFQLDGTVDIPLPPPPSFTNANDIVIGPPFANVYSPVQVAGVQPFQLGPGVIQSVCMNIDQNWLSDLDIYLQGPNGQFMELTTDNGSNGDDYTNTCFTPGATLPITYISPPASGAPYTGTFQAEGVWSDLWSSADNPTNGEWNLLLIDDANGFQGTLLDWTITFNPLYQLFYEWTPSTGLSCSDCPNPLAFPDVSTQYILRVYDSYGCEVFDTINVTVNNVLAAPVVQCGAISDTCITFTWTPVPGAAAYEVNVAGIGWELSNGLLSHTVCGLTFNETVTIQVRGVEACNGLIGEATCSTPDCVTPTPFVDQIIDASCFGLPDGSIQLSASGNYPPFDYTLDGVTNTTGLFTGLAAGDYLVTVSDSVNCPATLTVIVDAPLSMLLDEVVLADISCAGASDASLSVEVSGGSWPYTFAWDGGLADSLVTGIGAGPIAVTVTDANGCQVNGSFDLTEPDPLILGLSADSVACFGGNTGQALVTIAGGAEPYDILWGPNTGSQVTPLAIGLIAGAYSVTVTDANGCVAEGDVQIGENPPIVLVPLSLDASCNGTDDGAAQVNPSGGAGGYEYQWDANALNQTTQTAFNLDVGTYSVTVNDAAGCSESISIDVGAPNAMVVSISIDSTSCHDTQDGFGEITVSGGTPGYTFEWSDAGAATAIRSDLASGAQSVTITDNNGCFEIIDFDILSPDPVELSTSSTLVNCFGGADGTATVLASGGSGGYQYQWANLQSTPTATGLAAGTAGVTVTDINGCQASTTVTVSQPAQLQITSLTTTSALCFGTATGTAAVGVQGGTSPYNYQWSNGQSGPNAVGLVSGSVSVTVTDNNGCIVSQSATVSQPSALTTSMSSVNLSCSGSPDGTATVTPSGGTSPYSYSWSNGQTSQTAVNLPAGTASVTVTDAKGCTSVNSVVLTAPTALTITLQTQTVSCNGGSNGSVQVTVLTGTSPFQYAWSNGQTGPGISGLVAGSYLVTVTDANGCEQTASVQITQPQPLGANLTQVDALCHDTPTGMASVSAIYYGTSPANPANFTFAWNTFPVQTEATASGLMGGQTYTVTVTDPAGCTAVESITIGNPEQIDIFILSSTPASCYGSKDGAASAGAEGGSPPYSFQWSDNSTGAEATGLVAGAYGVTVTDSKGCTSATTVEVGQPSQLQLDFAIKPVNCYGESSGSATAIPEGGTAPYVANWSTGQGGFLIDALSTGAYQVTITDANGCVLQDEVFVPQPEIPIIAEFTEQDISCHGGADGAVFFDTWGGTAPYSYSIDGFNFVGAPQIYGLLPGTYNVYIRDSRGCEYISDDVVIDEPEAMIVDLGPDITIQAGEVAQLSADVQNAFGALSYLWQSITPDSLTCYDCPVTETQRPLFYSATFRLTVTDESGCEGEDIIRVLVDKEFPVMVPTGFTPNGDGANDLLLVHGRSGTRIFTFQVFDRWGEMVYDGSNFEVNDPNSGWDGVFKGQVMNSGVFLWYVEAILPDGEKASFKGTTTLIR